MRPSPGAKTVPFTWKGWPDADAPCLAITEGGARIGSAVSDDEQPSRLRRAFEETREERYGAGIVLFSNFLSWKDMGSPLTPSHLVERVVTRSEGGLGVEHDVEMLPAGAEPTAAEYRQLTRPVYSTWKALRETRTT